MSIKIDIVKKITYRKITTTVTVTQTLGMKRNTVRRERKKNRKWEEKRNEETGFKK